MTDAPEPMPPPDPDPEREARLQAASQTLMAETEWMQRGTAPARNPLSDRENQARVGRQIKYGTVLTPWMLAYAEWLTLECLDPPKKSLRTSRARGLARAPVTMLHLETLEARLDFIAYQNELRKGPLDRARAQFLAAFPEYISAHRKALAVATEAHDYAAMARIAEPVLDRVYPKKAEGVVATQVVVTLSAEQHRGVTAYEAPAMLVEEPAPEPESEVVTDTDPQ